MTGPLKGTTADPVETAEGQPAKKSVRAVAKALIPVMDSRFEEIVRASAPPPLPTARGRRIENGEGLTFAEWSAAATFGLTPNTRGKLAVEQALRWAWARGEDPTEWAVPAAAKR